jgi:predicted RNase H-like nuclease (RuvC/YqgF family)
METKPTLEAVLERLVAMEERLNARLDGLEARMTLGFKEIKSELSLIGRKIDVLAKADLDHTARIEQLEDLTAELTRPIPTN